MSIRCFLAVVALMVTSGVSTPAKAADVTEVVASMRHAIEPGDDMRASFELEIVNAKGESVEWSGKYYRKGGTGGRKRFVFEYPLDLRGTEVVVRGGSDGSDQTRIYLPALRRTRELVGDARGESFLGTDFNYEDLGLQQLDFQEHELLSDGEVDGWKCYRLESVPEHGWWYGKIIRWVDKKNFLPRRAEYYDREGVLWKVRTFDVVKKIDSFPTATQITMRTVTTGTSTRLILSNVRYNTGLSDRLFESP